MSYPNNMSEPMTETNPLVASEPLRLESTKSEERASVQEKTHKMRASH
jgi:hypothetical protein